MTATEKYFLQLIIPSRKKDSRLIGQAVHIFCLHLGLDEIESYHLELATVEAIHNIVNHAYKNCPDCIIKVYVKGMNDKIIFTLIDQGQPADFPLTKNCPVQPEEGISNLPESSMGIYIINSVMDSVKYDVFENKNILTMVKYLPKQ